MILGENAAVTRRGGRDAALRDELAVLFFVSGGMFFDQWCWVEQRGPVIATVAIIILAVARAYALVRAFGPYRGPR